MKRLKLMFCPNGLNEQIASKGTSQEEGIYWYFPPFQVLSRTSPVLKDPDFNSNQFILYLPSHGERISTYLLSFPSMRSMPLRDATSRRSEFWKGLYLNLGEVETPPPHISNKGRTVQQMYHLKSFIWISQTSSMTSLYFSK